MTNREAIEQSRERLAITDYRQQIPEYYEAIEMAVEALETQMQNCENCLHAGPLQISHNTVFCFEHSCAMSSDNCCREWIQRLGERR